MNQMRNSVSGEQLRGFVERIEAIREQVKDLSDDEKVIFAEAQAAGLVPKVVRYVLKVRATKPSDFQEAQALADMYLSALGMAPEPPLFRAMGLISVDVNAREQIVEALKKFVPAAGSITIDGGGGVPIRLTRTKDGAVEVAEITKLATAPSEPAKPKPAKDKPPVPDVDPDGAEALGRQAAQDDVPIIANPFPFGDPRRPRWDVGWRREAGSDGMGPDD